MNIKDMKYAFITGPAGSGKTTLTGNLVADNPSWGLVTATTGVAARVLGEGTPTVDD
jgi:guanylate kinase